ncbi:MAG: hypothetical protein QHH15_00195 [Candidatus Thermoplasmatota archaeon]|nr:hypothetical protein [Candidatus Thermoplasmatota archaeon]
MYLEQVSSKKEDEIRKMPYPKFREYISFYTEPDKFIKTRLTKEEQEEELDRIKRLKKQLEGGLP